MDVMNTSEFSKPAQGGPDVSLWTDRGFPGASLMNKNERYFWFHHSNGDRMDLETPENLDKCTALWAAASYVIADLSVNIPKTVKKN
jgi:carboxypeptidase Q